MLLKKELIEGSNIITQKDMMKRMLYDFISVMEYKDRKVLFLWSLSIYNENEC